MAHIAVLGASLGGRLIAFELEDRLGAEDRVTVVNKGAFAWRARQLADYETALAPR